MSPEKLKVAVTGLGVSRNRFIPYWMAAPETELILLHDIDAGLAEELSKQFAVPSTTDFAEVLASAADILDVSTPNHVHVDQAVAAMEAGKHVYCQKPMAPTVRQCRTMIDAAHKTGKTLGMCMDRLSRPHAGDIREMVQGGFIGKVAQVRTRNAHRGAYHSPGPYGWRAKRENIGGGSFMQLAVHGINFVLWCLGEGVRSVTGYSKNLYCRHSIEGEDLTAAVGELESGALISMESGYSSVGNATEFYGTEGHILMTAGSVYLELARDFDGRVITYARPSCEDKTVRIDMSAIREASEPLVGETNQNRAFARAVLAGEAPPVPAEVGLRDVAIMQAVYRSAAEGRPVDVEELYAEA